MKNLSITNNLPVNVQFWFDEQFSVSDLKASIEKEEEQSDSVIKKAQQILQKAYSKDNSDDFEYVVDLTAEQKHAIAVGDIKLDVGKDGDVFAQLRNADGHYGDKLPIKKQLAAEGISPEALLLALQMEAVKEQLSKMLDTLKEIEQSVQDVLTGQRNDRRGLYYSGLTLFLEGKLVRDETLKKQIFAQALKAINDSNAQVLQDLRTSIEYLVTEQYKREKKMTQKIEEHLNVIKQGHGVIFRAAYTKASIYQESNEPGAMYAAIGEYGQFIEKLIKPYAGVLTELDKKNQFIESGEWGKLSDRLTDCNMICKQIANSSTFYLTQKEA